MRVTVKADPRSNGTRWRRAKAELRAQERPCWICLAFGRPAAIDYALPALDPGSFEADHLVPTSKGGSLWDADNLDAAHRACNEWRGNKSVAEVLAITRRSRTAAARQVETTTEW